MARGNSYTVHRLVRETRGERIKRKTIGRAKASVRRWTESAWAWLGNVWNRVREELRQAREGR